MSRRPTNMEFYGERLVEIRKLRGYSISDLAENVGVSRQMVHHYEQGSKYPSREVLMRLCSALEMPMQYFSLNLYTLPGEDETPVFFRRYKKAPSKAQHAIILYHKWLEHIYSFMEEYVNFPSINQSFWEVTPGEPRHKLNFDIIERAAEKSREVLGVGLGPISNVTLLLEKSGIIIGKAPGIDKNIDAGAKRKGTKGFILLGLKKSAVRHRFDVAHELGHMVLHHRIFSEDIQSDPKLADQLEAEANYFASAFLFPRETFYKEFTELSPDVLMRLKARWKISWAAMAMRGKNLRIVDEIAHGQFERLRQVRGWRLHEPLDDEIVSEQPSLFKKAIRLLIENGVLSGNDMMQSLAIPRTDFLHLVNMAQTDLIESGAPVSLLSFQKHR